MRKYLKYFIISLVLLFCYSINVSALDCYYKYEPYIKTPNDNDVKVDLEAHFRINGGDEEENNKGKIVFSGVYGTMRSKDDNNQGDSEELPPLYRTVKGQGQGIENWNTFFDRGLDGIGFKNEYIGKDKYLETGECPEYAILVDRAGQFDLVVADKENADSIKANAEGKQGFEILKLQDKENLVMYYPSSCLGLNKVSCEENLNFACVWNEEHQYCNVDNLLYVGCGDARDIPIQVPELISLLVNLLKIATPIILIFMGIITLVKALAASKEDEIKKAQGSLVKKLIAAAMVFFVVTIVQFVISLVADAEYESEVNHETEKKNLSDCLECFLDGNCDRTAYYKTNIAGQDYCTYLDNSENFDLCPEEKASGN